MIKYIALVITLYTGFQMYQHWDSALFNAWFIGFTGWINVFLHRYEIEKYKVVSKEVV